MLSISTIGERVRSYSARERALAVLAVVATAIGVIRDSTVSYLIALVGLGALVVSRATRRQTDTPDESPPPDRTFTIHAIQVDTLYSNYGLHNPKNTMYVLKQNRNTAMDAAYDPNRNEDTGVGTSIQNTSDGDRSLLEPLTIRANAGEVIEIEFHNELDRPASMHPIGLSYDVRTSDGMNAGDNPDTTVEEGGHITYRWKATEEGTYVFVDGVNHAEGSADVNLPKRGLFGALVVEPEGATWSDPETGDSLESGTKAIIHDPTGPDHREFLVFYHNVGGAVEPKEVREDEELDQKVAGMNYRAVRSIERNNLSDPKREKKGFYSSFPHGDPGGGDAVFDTYEGDPVKMVAISTSIEENHVHHLHGHRWRKNPHGWRKNSHRWRKNPPSAWTEPFDSETIGMCGTRETYLVAAYGERSTRACMSWEDAFAVGAGGPHGSVGDFLFHCHLFPHYGEGMNGLMRVHDEQQDALVPLDNNPPPFGNTDADGPGFPGFIPTVGTTGTGIEDFPAFPPDRRPADSNPQRAPELTPRELALPGRPGMPYTDPVVNDDINGYAEKREYHIVAVETDLTYNDAGDHDPAGIVYVLEEDVEAVKEGHNPEPLFIRANVGDLVEVTFENRTENPLSVHPHFVSFDVLGSDSSMVGYNYDSGVDPGETGRFRWYADEEGPVFVHDHMSGLDFGQNGPFAVLIVEPRGADWLDPNTGEPIRSGSQAMIVDADDPEVADFREFGLLYHDFAQLVEAGRDRPGDPTDDGWVTQQAQHGINQGVMGINYRNAPHYRRLKRDEIGEVDPAYAYSSAVLGDPPTPVLETYPEDPVRIRLVMGPYEEFHNFTLHGHQPTPEDRVEEPRSQIVGVSEKFSFELPQAEHGLADPLDNPDGWPIRDYLYGSTITDDLGNGMWGIYRVFGAAVDHLEPLPDRGAPSGSIAESDLRDLGHPAPFDDRGEEGQRAAVDNPTARLNDNIGQKPGEALDPDDIPEQAPGPGAVSPDPDGTVRRYEVAAVQTTLRRNEYGDHTEGAIVFVPEADADAVAGGNGPKTTGDGEWAAPESLTIRANEGDVVEVQLHNRLFEGIEYNDRGPTIRAEDQQAPFPQSNRISLHPQGTVYDVQGSDGAAVGFNHDSTVAPGESITYRWKVTADVDSCVLQDMADVVGHWPYGAFGDLLVEPAGAEWLDPETGAPLDPGYGTRAVIDPLNEDAFREFSITFADSQFIETVEGEDACVVPRDDEADKSTPCNRLHDPEEQGFGTINHRSEPFRHRFDENDAQRLVYDSGTHGDPNTPVFRAVTGDPVRFRVSQPAANSRGVTFHLAGHRWKRYPTVSGSPRIGLDDDLIPGYNSLVIPEGGAGGAFGVPGDYLFQELKQAGRLEDGMWGLFRVGSDTEAFENTIIPLPD